MIGNPNNSIERHNLLRGFSTKKLRSELKRREQAGDIGELTSKIGGQAASILTNQVKLSPEEQRFTQEITKYLKHFPADGYSYEKFSNNEGDEKFIKKSGNYFSYGHLDTDRDDVNERPLIYDANEYRIYIDKEGKVRYDSGDFYKGTNKDGNPYDESIQKIRTDIMKPAIDDHLRRKRVW